MSRAIVGIGASAGGLEPLTELLKEIPKNSGLTFIVVQHLDPKHKSALPELLARATSMPVRQAEDDMAVEPNHVYVIPPGFNLEIEGRVLKLVPRPETRAAPMPIDHFFRLLAQAHERRAIGIILSGTGSDGSLGLYEIKERGGVAFAQDESTAKYPGMPHSAIATGAVDFVLPVEQIAQELMRIVRHPYVAVLGGRKTKTPAPVEHGELNRLLGLVRGAMKTDFTHYKSSTIARRISRRMALRKIEKVGEYEDYLRDNPAELKALYHDLLIKVTGFFRDPETFEALKRSVIPAILKDHPPDKPIRIWVPGCASGEEAYSIAICFLECLGDKATDASLRIFATDVDDAALQKARAGIYLENIATAVSAERLRRFFTRGASTYQINKSIREMCTFARHDLGEDPPFSNVDLISCRNVLIYFEPILQKRVLSIFHYALNPKGFLALGVSESSGSSAQLFALEDRKNKIYSRKAGKTPIMFDFDRKAFRTEEGEARHGGGAWKQSQAVDPIREADYALLNYFAPVGVLLDDQLRVLQFRGQTDRYLAPAPGKASLDILKMAREGLLGELQDSIDEARRTGIPVVRRGIRIRFDENWLTLTLRVVPLESPESRARQFMVLFEEPAAPSDRTKKRQLREISAKGKTPRQENFILRRELEATKQHLQTVIESQEGVNEELRSANEEVLSSNEELQSTNEELETSKEELQSTNEELATANDELQRRIAELDVANADLNNLFASARLPIIMLGKDLRIRRLTEASQELFSVLPTDIGRPLADLKLNIQTADLESLVSSAIDAAGPREVELQDRRGTWYSLQIRPYVNVSDKVEGAVLLFIDLTQFKSAEKLIGALEEARGARDYSEGIVQTVPEPLLVLDNDFRVVTANPAYHALFKNSKGGIEGQSLFSLGKGLWDVPVLRKALTDVLSKDGEFHDLEIECALPDVGQRILLANGRRIRLGGQRKELILLALEDVTDRSAAVQELEAFSYSVAHDLRTPIRSIVTYSQLVLKKGDAMDAASRSYLQKSILASKRMAKLIDDLLELARLSRKELKQQPLDISAAARSIADELKQEQPDRNVEFRIAKGLKATGDPDLVRIALRNLLDNAWKFTGRTPKAVIEVGQGLKDGKNVFFVRDNGVGFDMAYVKKLFGVFQRLHDEKQFPGTGIGLVTVQRIIRRHGGDIWVEGQVNRGATAYFTLLGS